MSKSVSAHSNDRVSQSETAWNRDHKLSRLVVCKNLVTYFFQLGESPASRGQTLHKCFKS